ncbi:G-alpha-domain-containing protein [Dendrothele bispora CBS 962.96]|uniref:G-alpha-domain-containing protein n=1 Tax=Dendrothele bispora (strain CBS 962.96) TaxID=1314807 RepID=A0A4S8MKW2_DENBC|nr:G-alpha-domain-containing protein [Dendrothele bispora CBS 962.96]
MSPSIDIDPLALAIAPPLNETPQEREAREHAEAEATRISNEIDEQIRKERDRERKKRRPVKLLLLGQSESGKTATLKNFQLIYARREWLEERNAWRPVVFFNLVRNVNNILDLLNREMTSQHARRDTISSSDESSEDSQLPPLRFREKHRLLKLRLGPLKRVQTDLERRLGSTAVEPHTTSVTTAAPFEEGLNRPALQEFSINSSNGWKSALEKIKGMRHPRPDETEGSLRKVKDVDDEIAEVIAGCKDDIKAIWEDSTVRELLNRSKVRLEDTAGFFLNDVDRIAATNYQPSDDDVVRARLRTLGVQEYKFIFENGRTAGQEWRLYDVGGTRSTRAAWYPYFDDVSCFDEKLAEDRRVNRLEDSYLLWRSICSCKLLARTQIILFLNKCDLLQAKLQRGVRIRDSVPSFGDRRNDLSTATRYFQQHFREILKQYSPVQRSFFVHLTSVIDTRSTAATLGTVEESILRDHLRRADLM